MRDTEASAHSKSTGSSRKRAKVEEDAGSDAKRSAGRGCGVCKIEEGAAPLHASSQRPRRQVRAGAGTSSASTLQARSSM